MDNLDIYRNIKENKANYYLRNIMNSKLLSLYRVVLRNSLKQLDRGMKSSFAREKIKIFLIYHLFAKSAYTAIHFHYSNRRN